MWKSFKLSKLVIIMACLGLMLLGGQLLTKSIFAQTVGECVNGQTYLGYGVWSPGCAGDPGSSQAPGQVPYASPPHASPPHVSPYVSPYTSPYTSPYATPYVSPYATPPAPIVIPSRQTTNVSVANANSNSNSNTNTSNSSSVSQAQGGSANVNMSTSAPTTVTQAATYSQPSSVSYAQPKVAGVTYYPGVQQLPKTGLPLLAWVAGAFLPMGVKLGRFRKGLSENETSASIFEKRRWLKN